MSASTPLDFSMQEGTSDLGPVLVLAGELDVIAAPLLGNAIRSLLDAGESFVVDLGGVTFIDSSGLGAILKTATTAEERALLSLAPSQHLQPRKLIELTGTASVLTVLEQAPEVAIGPQDGSSAVG